MLHEIHNLLQELGFSETESKIYFASLQLGPTNVQSIAKKAGVSRTSSYDAINGLKEKGLFSSYEQDGRSVFAAANPERALQYLEDQQAKRNKLMEQFSTFLPQINSIKAGDKPSVSFYEGPEAVRAVFQDFDDSGADAVDEVSNLDDVYHTIVYGSEDIRRVFEDIRHVLDPSKLTMRILHYGAVDPSRARPHVKFCELNKEYGEFHGDIWIYSDRVVFITFVGNVRAVILQNQEFADTARALFNAAWTICSATNSVFINTPK